MSQFIFKMPDLGEGTVEAEIVAWRTQPGDTVAEDQVIVEVMTDKAAVEVPAPVSGRVVSTSGQPGDKIAVGSPLIVFDTAAAPGNGAAVQASGPPAKAAPARAAQTSTRTRETADSSAPPEPAPPHAIEPAEPALAPEPAVSRTAKPEDSADPSNRVAHATRAGRVMASPANRRRAHEAGIDLATIAGSGPGGRIVSGDLAAAGVASARDAARVPSTQTSGTSSQSRAVQPDGKPTADAGAAPAITEIKVIGVRRLIAERMSEAKRTIPHFAYVEEVDVTELESLRQHLNGKLPKGQPGLTYLPWIVLALTRVLEAFPQCNVLYDAGRGVLVRHRDVHVGIATQTPDGLKVPVVRNAQGLSLWQLGAEIRRVTERARTNKATREELVGSTVTVTSLGKLGGIASTPVINAPEVAIIGLNKAVERPVVHGGAVTVRRIMNLSSSFDHRFVDGYDAAAMIQALKELLEHPATIFIPKVNFS